MSASRQPVPLAFCITDLDPGGAERTLVRLVTGLNRDRWAPAVYCLAPEGALAAELRECGIPVCCLGARSRWNLTVLPRLVRRLREQRPALLQTFLFHANIAGRIAGRLAGVPRIVSGIRVAERRSRLPLWVDRMTDRCVDRHVAVSRAVAEFSVREGGLPINKVTVIPNAIDAERFSDTPPADLAEFGIPPGSRVLLFAGRLDPQKAPDLLVEAAADLLHESGYEDMHLLLVGEGPLRNTLTQRIRELDLDARIHLAGWRADVPALMKAACALVLSSRWEGMPNVVLEAMAAGLPVIASEVEGTAELLRDGETGLLVSADSPAALREGIKRLLDDAPAAREMGLSAQETVKKEFTFQKLVERYEALYVSLLG